MSLSPPPDVESGTLHRRRPRPVATSMRDVHRWISVVVGLFMLAIACSGLALQVEASVKGGWTIGPPKPHAGATPAAGGLPATVAPAVPASSPPGDLHLFLLQLHRGDLFGPVGTWISILCGVALVILSVTGLWVYIDLLRRRLKGDRRGLFWR